MMLNLHDLEELPEQAKYSEKSGQATVEVQKTGNGNYIVSANCDSLLFLIEEKETKIFHLQTENKELVDKMEKREVEIIREPTGSQWFQIYGFRILLIAIVVVFTFKKFNIWQKMLSLLKKLFR